MSESLKIQTQLKQLVTDTIVYNYKVIPFDYIENQTLTLETFIENQSESLKNELQIILGHPIDFKTIDKALLEQKTSFNYPKSKHKQNIEKFEYNEDFLSNIILRAKNLDCSDIHFEVFENKARIRFRLDGKLTEQYIVEKNTYPIVLNKIKILAHLDISEKRLPQDGRIKISHHNNEFDVRVSILPSLYGEKIVLRILSKDPSKIALEQLGFTPKDLKTYLKHIHKQNGIILVSGPTGSGKTTTLYATLKELNKEDTNILTVEDPIEYTLEGITQVQLKENIGLTFPKVLKTFLRQDPDIIMVGEIRDMETANIAIRAALTGHLVLSTIHTNSAWATVNRLIDMGIPPFLIADTLELSIAQRLVRILCNHCKVYQPIETLDSDILEKHKITHAYHPIGCTECYQTGYNGRKAIYEIVPITENLKTEIKNTTHTSNVSALENELQKKAIELLKNGETSLDEIYSYMI